MFSKKTFAFLALLVFAIGCSKGDIPDSQTHLKYGSTACFTGMGQRFQDFFKGTGTASDMHANWSCMNQVLADFSRINETDQFQKDKLEAFINDHYDLGLTDDTMQSVMKLKQVLVGGNLDVVTKTEIALIEQDLNALDAVTTTLAPYTRILFGDANATSSEDQWNVAYMTFAGQLPKLAALLSRQNLPYTFADLQTFAAALANQFGAANDSFIRKLANLMPAVGSAKVILISGPNDRMMPKEWLPLLSGVGTAYLTYQSVQRTMDLHPKDASLALNEPRIQVAVQNVVTILNNAVQARQNKQIAFAEISNLFQQLQAGGMFPKSFTPDQASSAIQFLILKVFPAPSSSQDGFDALHMAEMQKFAARWKTVQAAYTQGKASTIPDFQASIQTGKWSLNLDSNGRLSIPQGTASVRLEFSAMYTVMEWLGQKWGTWPMNPDQFHAAVGDILGLIHSFNYLLSKDDSYYLRLLREANLFVPSSNGDMQLQVNEAFQYALFALSSYRSMHALTQAANNKCGDDDFFCYQNVMLGNRVNLLSNFPNLDQWLGSDTVRYSDYTKELNVNVGSSEFMEFMELTYIETFMQLYDTDRDGLITLSETEAAFKVYGPVLTEMIKGVAPKDMGALFTFLFAYGRAPGTADYDSLRWGWWKISSSSWSFSADRKTLATILAELSKMN